MIADVKVGTNNDHKSSLQYSTYVFLLMMFTLTYNVIMMSVNLRIMSDSTNLVIMILFIRWFVKQLTK